ncbi:MAG: M23 family metallopeptidase [Bacteroidetes bacterium]|nr:M23 family metallopeptidase [Bacteroidota bacterium]
MAKHKYFYNPNKLDFERVGTSLATIVFRVFGFLSASVVAGALMVLAIYNFVDSPKEKSLKRENEQYKQQVQLLNKRIAELDKVLADLQDRDANIYRAIFEADPIDITIRKAGMGGADKYQELRGFESSDELITLNQKVDELAAKVNIQSKSFDELGKLAANKTEFLACIPAIQPISNKDLTRVASGYGYRIHPIFKTHKFHSGIDFTAPQGTPIYATGNGRVETAENGNGYGNHVIVNHGFGYRSLYAHMSRIKVRPGMKIQRGELLGYVGSTGTSTAPHVHYEIIRGDRKINPINYFFNDLTEEEYQAIRELANREGQSFD